MGVFNLARQVHTFMMMEFVPVGATRESVVFDMEAMKTKVYNCDRTPDPHSDDILEICVVSDVHKNILGLRKKVMTAAEAADADRQQKALEERQEAVFKSAMHG